MKFLNHENLELYGIPPQPVQLIVCTFQFLELKALVCVDYILYEENLQCWSGVASLLLSLARKLLVTSPFPPPLSQMWLSLVSHWRRLSREASWALMVSSCQLSSESLLTFWRSMVSVTPSLAHCSGHPYLTASNQPCDLQHSKSNTSDTRIRDVCHNQHKVWNGLWGMQ